MVTYSHYTLGYFEYLLFMLPAIIVVAVARIYVDSRFFKYSKIRNTRGISGFEAAQIILRANGVYNVRISPTEGKLSDHFNPADNTIYLSNDVFGEKSIAAVGIAAHEAGHAVQFAKGYFPMSLRHVLIPVCNIGSQAGIIILVIGGIIGFLELYVVGIALYGLTVLVQIVTLPVEFNASRRALKSIKVNHMLEAYEYKGARTMLSAAALTYIAALLTSILQTVFYILRLVSRRK